MRLRHVRPSEWKRQAARQSSGWSSRRSESAAALFLAVVQYRVIADKASRGLPQVCPFLYRHMIDLSMKLHHSWIAELSQPNGIRKSPKASLNALRIRFWAMRLPRVRSHSAERLFLHTVKR